MSVTRFRTLAHCTNQGALLELNPETGRKHQLRVTCATVLNSPIIGDFKYGNGVPSELQALLGTDTNLHLHASKILFPHPFIERKSVQIEAPLPPHMKTTSQFLGLIMNTK